MAVPPGDLLDGIYWVPAVAQSAWIVRHLNGDRPKPTSGPKGREKMLKLFARRLEQIH
jgi:hypothetical protein